MSRWEQVRELPLWTLMPMAAAAGVILWRRWCWPGALRGAPSRVIGLGAADLLVGVGLMLLGMSAAGWAFSSQSNGPSQDHVPLAVYTARLIGGQLLSLGLAGLYLAVRAGIGRDGGRRRIGLWPRAWGRELAIGAGGAALAMMLVPGVIVLGALAGVMLGHEPPAIAHELLTRLRDDGSTGGAVMVLASAVILAPLLEEIVYRGLWQSMLVEALGEDRRGSAVAVAATVFAAMHLGAVEAQAMAGLWILGLMFGWVYERTGSLLPGVIMHATFNACNVALVLAGQA